jgi:hypothetical protein
MDAPWRLGWDISDPRRPCWTCGAPPAGAFSDGSPSYRCWRSSPIPHRPVVLRETPPERWAVVLSPAEVRAARRLAAAALRRRSGRQPPVDGEALARWFGGEIAASKIAGLPHRARTTRRGIAIGARTEVRTYRLPELVLSPTDSPRRCYVLMLGGPTRYVLAGWIEGDSAMRAVYANNNGGWTVPISDLSPPPLPEDA